MRVLCLVLVVPLLALLPAPAEAVSPAAIAAELSRLRTRPRAISRRSVVETNTHGEPADHTTTISRGQYRDGTGDHTTTISRGQ